MSRGELGFVAAVVAVFVAIAGLVIAFPSPTITVCDERRSYTTIEYNVALKMTLPVTRSRCVLSHEEPNPRYRPRN